MRVLDTIPHPQLRISIFGLNQKYQVKFEAGPYEQTYKVEAEDVKGIAGLKTMINDEMLEKVAGIFREMHRSNPWLVKP
jgi:hypothetical protein